MEEQNTNAATPIQEPIPGAVMVFVFGIIALSLSWLGILFIVPGVIPLIFGIIAMIKGSKLNKLYLENPDKYLKNHGTFSKIGRMLGMIGWILAIVFMIIFVLLVLVLGSKLF